MGFYGSYAFRSLIQTQIITKVEKYLTVIQYVRYIRMVLTQACQTK